MAALTTTWASSMESAASWTRPRSITAKPLRSMRPWGIKRAWPQITPAWAISIISAVSWTRPVIIGEKV
jgi:hypothetical protein